MSLLSWIKYHRLAILHEHHSVYPEHAHTTNMKCLSFICKSSLVNLESTHISDSGYELDLHICILKSLDCIQNLENLALLVIILEASWDLHPSLNMDSWPSPRHESNVRGHSVWVKLLLVNIFPCKLWLITLKCLQFYVITFLGMKADA